MISVLIFLCGVVSVASNALYLNTTISYDENEAYTGVYLSSAAYCGASEYMSINFKDLLKGFVVTNVIDAPTSDVQGFIGYLPSDSSIYVVFRGSSSIQNWIVDLDVLKTEYTTFPECGCQVHAGFFKSEQYVINDIITEVKSLREKFPSYHVKTTGHSLGAALAALAALDLIASGIPTTSYTYGQPRVGDEKFASFVSSKLSIVRVTHNKDIVPHVPVTTGMDFYHMCREAFENESGAVRLCDTSCEDPTCSDQFRLAQTTVDDHLHYLGVDLTCGSV